MKNQARHHACQPEVPKNIREKKIPVLSCEGACIRGEIARLAANIVSREKSFARGCHGELITVPESSIARWIKTAEKVVLIDERKTSRGITRTSVLFICLSPYLLTLG